MSPCAHDKKGGEHDEWLAYSYVNAETVDEVLANMEQEIVSKGGEFIPYE